jgi:hypothetical protein
MDAAVTASDQVSSAQFGFLKASEHETPWSPHSVSYTQDQIKASAKPKMMDLSKPLHTRQVHMSNAAVSDYAAHPKKMSRANQLDPPLVVHMGGEDVVHGGHHRIAANKARGKSKMKVMYHDLDNQ